jgi:carbon-monoxide dehydrogenase medium subunit
MEILQPTSLDETVTLLDRWGEDGKIIAGSTAMVLMLKNGLIAPAALISLGRLRDLDHVEHVPGTGLRLGALATLRTAEISETVRRHNPTLAETYGTVANVRIRNAATVGGNLCEADYASDPPATLLAMRGRVLARSVRGEREIPLTGFFRDYYETATAPDEIVTELIVPELSPSTRSAYIKYVSRSSEDRPCVGVAAVVELNEDGSCDALRVVVGAVSSTPMEVDSAEALASGEELTDELIGEVAEAYSEAIDPLEDLRGSKWYRKQMIRVFVRRAIEKAMANGGAPTE